MDNLSAETLRDYVLPFRIEGHDVNGRAVKLNSLASEVLSRHDYPEAVNRLLGEALVLVAMLGTMLKFDGRFILQLQGDGPLAMMMTDYTPNTDNAGELRGFAQFDADAVCAALQGQATPMALFGDKSHMAFTVDQGPDMERYQGIVPLQGDTLAEAALGYFARSEQIGTCLKLAAAPLLLAGGKTEWRAGGIVVQQTATAGGNAPVGQADPGHMDDARPDDAHLDDAHLIDDDWKRLSVLLETTQDSELLDAELSAEALAFRLFHEDGVRVFDARPLQFACPCSRTRVANMLRGLPDGDQNDMQAQGTIEVVCEFCNENYKFAPDEAFPTAR